MELKEDRTMVVPLLYPNVVMKNTLHTLTFCPLVLVSLYLLNLVRFLVDSADALAVH